MIECMYKYTFIFVCVCLRFCVPLSHWKVPSSTVIPLWLIHRRGRLQIIPLWLFRFDFFSSHPIFLFDFDFFSSYFSFGHFLWLLWSRILFNNNKNKNTDKFIHMQWKHCFLFSKTLTSKAHFIGLELVSQMDMFIGSFHTFNIHAAIWICVITH